MSEIITIGQLHDFGLTPDDVRRHGPHAVEYAADVGNSCWMRADPEPLLVERGEP